MRANIQKTTKLVDYSDHNELVSWSFAKKTPEGRSIERYRDNWDRIWKKESSEAQGKTA